MANHHQQHDDWQRLLGEITTRLDVLENEVERLRDFRHNFPQTLLGEIQVQFSELRDLIERNRQPPAWSAGENRQLTMRDVYVFCGGVGMFYAFAKLMKWL